MELIYGLVKEQKIIKSFIRINVICFAMEIESSQWNPE